MTEFFMDEDFYPLCLAYEPKEKIWGGRQLEQLLHKNLPPGKLIGETWEAWDGCRIANGKHQGRTVADLLAGEAQAILGPTLKDSTRLPLLFKYIDAQDDLSVQVHPNDHDAQVLEGYPFGKTEAWYVIDAEPHANLIHGFEQDTNLETVRNHLHENRLGNLLCSVSVQSGDVLFVPAGTVHAIGKGIVLAEIQQNSDITYRLYDWGRQSAGSGRELHLAQALHVSEFKRLAEHKIPALVLTHEQCEQRWLVACQYFVLELLVVHQPCRDLALNGKFHILSSIEGQADLLCGPQLKWRVAMPHGQTVLLPARLGAYGISPSSQPCKILRAYVPDLEADVVAPLKRAGYDAASIARLGGSLPQHNDLLPLLQIDSLRYSDILSATTELTSFTQ